jgi:FKBP-type peptidyl-prolyl cis-trans isomerase FkpA
MKYTGRTPLRRLMRRLSTAIGVAALGALFASGGCASAPPQPLEAITFAPSLMVDLDRMRMTPGGVRYEDLAPGEGGVVRTGQRVTVYYTGWLADGRQFDSTVRPAPPLTFRLGAGEVIAGWDEGLMGMRVGGQRRLAIPASLAYGNRRSGMVPPNAALVFVVQLVDAS